MIATLLFLALVGACYFAAVTGGLWSIPAWFLFAGALAVASRARARRRDADRLARLETWERMQRAGWRRP